MIDGNIAMNSHFENMSEKDMNDMHDHFTAIENNKLIAKFMEEKIIHSPYPDVQQKLPYHYSWDWLMPVVEKIEKLGYDSRIMGHDSDGGYLCDFVDIENNEAAQKTSYVSKIEAVWLCVVDFIQWHNTQKLIPNEQR